MRGDKSHISWGIYTCCCGKVTFLVLGVETRLNCKAHEWRIAVTDVGVTLDLLLYMSVDWVIQMLVHVARIPLGVAGHWMSLSDNHGVQQGVQGRH